MRGIRDIAAIKTMHYALEPRFYNRAQLALLRLGCPLELTMDKLQVTLELDHQHWTAFFMQEIGLPLIQWTSFKRARQGLNQPVECVLLLYHYHAWLMFPRVLMEMDKQLLQQLEARHLQNLPLP